MATYQDFYNLVINKGFDIDGYYGWQCWDGYAKYCQWLGYPYAHCGIHGYACDIWEQRKTNGILNYFDEVTVMKPGDVAVFKKVANWTPLSHIAIFHSDIDGVYGWFLGQNQNGLYKHASGGSSFNLTKLPYSATFDTAFRPKSLSGGSASNTSKFDKSALIEEIGKVTFTKDGIAARVNDPNGTICRRYNAGSWENYKYKWVGNGHRYVCWYEGANLIMCAVSGSEKYGVDKWAECTKIEEESKSEEKPEEVPNQNEEIVYQDKDTTKDYYLEQPDLAPEEFVPKSKLFEKYDIKFIPRLITDKAKICAKAPFVITPGCGTCHNFGGSKDPSAEEGNLALQRDETTKSWHFTIDESTIIQNISMNRNSFANGDYSTGFKSKNSINYEICRDMLPENDDKFTLAERNGAIFMAELMYQYGWDKSKIKKHQDWDMQDANGNITHKYCPHKTLDRGWDRYVDMVLGYLAEAKELDNPSKPDPEPEQPDTQPQEPEQNDSESIDTGKVNSLLDILIQIGKKILSIFK